MPDDNCNARGAEFELEGRSGSKLPYAGPQLHVFGSVRDLTRNGNGSGGDGGATAGMTML